MFSGLRVHVKGTVESKWLETWGNRRMPYVGSETLINAMTYLAGSRDGAAIDIPAGDHVYNFDCRLPENLPYSVEGSNGFITYEVTATLEIISAAEVKSIKPFTVLRHDDLRQVTTIDYRSPCEDEKLTTFCCFMCVTDPLVMTMRLPRSGYGLGEKIPVQVKLINGSTMGVYSSEFSLLQVEKLYSHTPARKTRLFEKVIDLKNSRGARAGQIVTVDEVLEIPENVPTSNDRFSEVFQIKYCVRFKAFVSDDMNHSPEMEIGITIGDIGIIDVSSTALRTTPTAVNDLRE